MRISRTVTLLLAAAAAAAATAQAAPDGAIGGRIALSRLVPDIVIPAEWGGIWDVTSTTYDCETNAVTGSDAYADTLCAGTVLDFGDPGFEITCTGSADGNTITSHCTGSLALSDDCTMNFDLQSTTTRTGDTYESVSTINTTYDGAECEFLPDSCDRVETTGTRTAPEPVPCGNTPVETVSWGTVKSLYR
ncbi:MAG TPA: hypothetical protein PLL30_09360 [Candidatus Krumholzibacteria bacterium]|nr:hypothetical protein [Candidatus Krumholzibacteria bacterium]HPD71969.1 hypothetical protein [Candidatus Krumholzibacteria bacterium]HRY41098.1 hypothetical protein [Candidatus Krumholzibacteria bacterium]